MEIPEDILIEILVQLPAYSLMRFKCVSELWYSLISSRYFTNLFFKFSSSTNPKRSVFIHWNHRELFSSLCNLDATSSFLQLNPDVTMGDYFWYSGLHFVNAIRGLVCFRDEMIRIINFTTRQILFLPQVESNILIKSDDEMVSPSLWNYLGYDSLNDEYKVLSTVSSVNKAKELRSETQVLVLGDGASWRNTKSCTSLPPTHRPSHLTSIINTVLYYGAWCHENIFVLMSFDFTSEEYNLIEFPNQDQAQAHISWEKYGKYYLLVNLMNYQDQVAVFDGFRLASESILDLWVLEDAGTSKWLHKVFVLPSRLKGTFSAYSLKIRGTSHSGEITLCEACWNKKKIKYIIYDLERNHIKRMVGIEPSYVSGLLEMNIWDDVESIIYLEA